MVSQVQENDKNGFYLTFIFSTLILQTMLLVCIFTNYYVATDPNTSIFTKLSSIIQSINNPMLIYSFLTFITYVPPFFLLCNYHNAKKTALNNTLVIIISGVLMTFLVMFYQYKVTSVPIYEHLTSMDNPILRKALVWFVVEFIFGCIIHLISNKQLRFGRFTCSATAWFWIHALVIIVGLIFVSKSFISVAVCGFLRILCVFICYNYTGTSYYKKGMILYIMLISSCITLGLFYLLATVCNTTHAPVAHNNVGYARRLGGWLVGKIGL